MGIEGQGNSLRGVLTCDGDVRVLFILSIVTAEVYLLYHTVIL